MKNYWILLGVSLAGFFAQADCFLLEVEPHEHNIPHAPEAVVQPAQSDGWNYSAAAYLWMADLGGETVLGTDIDADSDDLLGDLQGAAVVTLGARHDKWSFILDTIYLNAEDVHNRGVNPLVSVTDVQLSAWVVTPMVGYNIIRNDTLDLNLLAGIRYVYLDSEVNVRTPLQNRKQSSSGGAWNGIAGLEGQVDLSEHWSLPFHVDAGTGETDFTWQAYAGVGYALTEQFSLFGGYRYLALEFDDDDPNTGGDLFDDLTLSGGIVGVKYLF